MRQRCATSSPARRIRAAVDVATPGARRQRPTRRDRDSLIPLARVWAYPLWRVVVSSDAAADIAEDIEFWIECIDEPDLSALDRYSRFAYLTAALTEFRTLVHYRLRTRSLPLRLLLKKLYRPSATLTLQADRIGPALFIQHGVGTIVTAESIGSHCWINQQVTIGYNAKGRPTLRDRVRVGAGAVVVGPITLYDDATVGANATVIGDVPSGVTVVAPPARILERRHPHDAAPG